MTWRGLVQMETLLVGCSKRSEGSLSNHHQPQRHLSRPQHHWHFLSHPQLRLHHHQRHHRQRRHHHQRQHH